MDATLIGVVFTGVIGLITAVGGILNNRQSRMKVQLATVEERLEAALDVLFADRLTMREAGLPLTPLPDILRSRRDYTDDLLR